MAIETTGWPSATTWPDLEAHRRHDAAARRAQDGVLEAVARELELALVGLGRRLRLLRAGLRLLFVGCAHRAVGLQRLQALAVRFRLARLRRGGDELLARGFLGEPVVRVVEHRDDVALAHDLADVDLALGDLAADAEGLVHLVARLHRADVAIGLARAVVTDFGRAHGAQRFGGRLVWGARGKQRGEGCGEKGRSDGRFSRRFLLFCDRLEGLPASAERLVELHAVEQQLGAAVVRADLHDQS